MNKYFTFLLVFIASIQLSLAGWQDRAMKKINHKIEKINDCKCLSKTQEIDKSNIKFYFTPKKIELVKIIEKQSNGSLQVYYFDKKSHDLIATQINTTIYYYQSTGYFAVLSSDNFTPDEAKKRSQVLAQKAEHFISKIE